MAFEIFSRKVRRTGAPSVTFTKLGRLQFNKAASNILEKEAVENLLLLWDPEKTLIGLRTITKKDPRAYRVAYGGKGNVAGFSAKTFLDYAGIDYSESKVISLDRGDGDILFVGSIPSEFFVKSRQQPLLLENSRKGRTA